jgi:FtsP/CotA-like multicopper oxidase with cupredoxin domain
MQSFNTDNPLRKDTVYVPSMGYVVLRFPLNNDGLWLLHCHVMWHQAIGMGIVLQVGEDIPQDTRARVAAQCS